MRWTHFFLFQSLLIVIVGSIVYVHKDRVIIIKTPPASLAQWYKPENKRQIWLHNMFKLRREMQAVRFYATKNDAEHLHEWANALAENYLKIAEMVPEWKRKLKLELIAEIQANIKNNHYEDIHPALDKLTESCDSCHSDYRASTAMMYRSPDFSTIKINSSTAFNEHMNELTEQVNKIKITFKDGLNDIALLSLDELKKGMSELGKTCSNCHKKDTRLYPDDTINRTIIRLAESLKTGTLKEQGQELGTLAVQACARCHGTHRLASDGRKMLTEGSNWRELIKH